MTYLSVVDVAFARHVLMASAFILDHMRIVITPMGPAHWRIDVPPETSGAQMHALTQWLRYEMPMWMCIDVDRIDVEREAPA